MEHATSAALAKLTELLDKIRLKAGIEEKKPGIFYRKSRAFLHFHEDPAGLFADLNVATEFQRHAVNTPGERRSLPAAIDQAVQSGRAGSES